MKTLVATFLRYEKSDMFAALFFVLRYISPNTNQVNVNVWCRPHRLSDVVFWCYRSRVEFAADFHWYNSNGCSVLPTSERRKESKFCRHRTVNNESNIRSQNARELNFPTISKINQLNTFIRSTHLLSSKTELQWNFVVTYLTGLL